MNADKTATVIHHVHYLLLCSAPAAINHRSPVVSMPIDPMEASSASAVAIGASRAPLWMADSVMDRVTSISALTLPGPFEAKNLQTPNSVEQGSVGPLFGGCALPAWQTSLGTAFSISGATSEGQHMPLPMPMSLASQVSLPGMESFQQGSMAHLGTSSRLEAAASFQASMESMLAVPPLHTGPLDGQLVAPVVKRLVAPTPIRMRRAHASEGWPV